MTLYFVTVFRDVGRDDLGWPIIEDCRTVGFYSSYEDACNAVINNTCDIYEDCYTYAVVEAIDEGVYNSYGAERTFFCWFFGQYVPIKPHRDFEEIAVFATIG